MDHLYNHLYKSKLDYDYLHDMLFEVRMFQDKDQHIFDLHMLYPMDILN